MMAVEIKKDSALVTGSSFLNNADGVFTWIVNLSQRWIGFDVVKEKNDNKDQLKIYLDEGTKQGTITLTGFACSQYKILSEIEKDQVIVTLIHKELLAKDNNLVARLGDS